VLIPLPRHNPGRDSGGTRCDVHRPSKQPPAVHVCIARPRRRLAGTGARARRENRHRGRGVSDFRAHEAATSPGKR